MPPRALTAQAVADAVGGRLCGAGGALISHIAPLDHAGPDAVSLLTSRTYLLQFQHSNAGVVLLRPEDEHLAGGPAGRIVVDDPHAAVATLLALLAGREEKETGVHPTVILGTGVTLGPDVAIGPGTVVGNDVCIGNGTVLGPGVVLEEGVSIGAGCRIGARVVCHSGTVIGKVVQIKAGAIIGGIGFGYTSSQDGHTRIPHIGRCVIGDHVDIGSNSCIDRGSIADTVIGEGSKLDNLVHVGHNVRIGSHCLLMAGVGVAGSAVIEDGVILAGHVGVTGHVTVGADSRIGAGSKVWGSVPPAATYSGLPAQPHRSHLRGQAALIRLAPLTAQLERLVREHRDRETDE